jgi:predicted permease
LVIGDLRFVIGRETKFENRNSKIETGQAAVQLRVSSFEFRSSSFEFRVSNFEFPVSVFDFRISIFDSEKEAVMFRVKSIAAGLRALFRKKQVEREMDEELRGYLDAAVQEKMRAGMSHEKALRAARVEMGSVEAVKEEIRSAGWEASVESLWQDLRYGLRQLARNPGFTAVVVIILALGIGANTAIFSLIDAVMLKTLPVKDPNQLVMLRWQARNWPKTERYSGWSGCPAGEETGCSFSYPTFQRVREQRQVVFEAFAAPGLGQFIVIARGEANPAMGELVTGEFFSTLGVSAHLGRTFIPEDDKPGSPPVAVVSYGFWVSRLGADTDAVGMPITVNGVPFTVVGVAAPQFRGLQPGFSSDLWLPLSTERVLNPGDNSEFDGRGWWLQIVACVKRGVKIEQARAALEVGFLQAANAVPKLGFKPDDKPHLVLDPAGRGFGMLRKFFAQPLLVLLALTGLVLLIACANLANLMLARTTTRQREIAVRRALGARRARVVRQLLTESVLLAVAGGVVGLLLAWQGSSALAAFISDNWFAPLSLEVSPNWRILAFTAAVSCAIGILSGLAPALRGTGMDLTPALKAAPGAVGLAGRRGRRPLLRHALVVWQVALATVVVVGTGLFLRTLVKLHSVDLGFNPRNLLLFEISPEQSGYKNEAVRRLYQQMLSRVSALPGVVSASFSNHALVSSSLDTGDFWIRGEAHPIQTEADWLKVGPGFFETLGIPILRGRGITAQDFESTRNVAVINAALARRYFAGQNPIGRQIGLGQDFKDAFEIVGVVRDAKYDEVAKEVVPTFYTPLRAWGASFALRTALDPKTLIPTVHRAVREIDAKLPILSIQTQTQQIAKTLFEQRLIADLSSLFGILAVVLACVGLYGVVSYGVAQRTNEIGIRLALGAERRGILLLVLRQGMVLALAGLALGVMGAAVLTRLLKAFLYGVKPMDLATFAGSSLLLLAVELMASYLPARRATAVDPMVALRYE